MVMVPAIVMTGAQDVNKVEVGICGWVPDEDVDGNGRTDCLEDWTTSVTEMAMAPEIVMTDVQMTETRSGWSMRVWCTRR